MSYAPETMECFAQLYKQLFELCQHERETSVEQTSPYSRAINVYIKTPQELDVYIILQLKEAFVTRPSLILNIDPFFEDKNGVTNIEKMREGKPPLDTKSGDVIHLHHIGQQADSPFAELPQQLHNSAGYFSKLHYSSENSWRNNKSELKQTLEEIKRYWKLRGMMINEKIGTR